MSSLHFRYRRILRCFFAFLLCFTGMATLHAQTYGNFSYSVANGATTITGYNGAGGAIAIPSSINGYSVTSIGDNAFSNCSNLTSVTIPNSVTSIGRAAFSNCSDLTSLTIPNSVTSIADSTFQYCYGLTSVTIPNSVTSIRSDAFHGCSSLTSVTIPNSVTSIGDYAFYACSDLTSVTIPNSVTSIGYYAFTFCYGLTSVSLPETFRPDAAFIGLSEQVAGVSLIKDIGNYLGGNSAFISDFTSTVLSQNGNYGLATKKDLSTAVAPLALKSDLTPLASKTDLKALSSNAEFVAALVKNPVFMEALAKQIASGVGDYERSLKQNQTLSFLVIPAQTYKANKTLKLTATSSAKLTPITYVSSDPAMATVAGNVVKLKGKGSATITASQAGNSTYNSATSSQVLTVK